MGISKGGVDLNGTSVALQCPLHILHFLQCVAHVRVGISKCGADSVSETERQRSILGMHQDVMHSHIIEINTKVQRL